MNEEFQVGDLIKFNKKYAKRFKVDGSIYRILNIEVDRSGDQIIDFETVYGNAELRIVESDDLLKSPFHNFDKAHFELCNAIEIAQWRKETGE